MFSCHKNSYLQGNLRDVPPRVINRCVQKAVDWIHIDEHDLDPPFQRLTSEQPTIPVKHVDVTRRPIAFGRWALPKLRRELHHKDQQVVLAAITSILDLVHDPERGYEAIQLRIVDRFLDLVTHENPAIRERSAQTLKVIAGLADGKEAIVSNKYLLDNIAVVLEDVMGTVRMNIAACVETIASFWQTADVLVENGFIQLLLSNLLEEHDATVEIHLETLKSLMYGSGKQIVLDENGFEIFLKLLDRNHGKILSKTCDCLAMLASTKEGEKLAQANDLLPLLTKLLHDERSIVHTSAAAALMYCTIKTKSKIKASNISELPKRLVTLAKNRLNPTTQMFAIKALTNISEHPKVRREMKENLYKDVEEIQVGDNESIKEMKNILMTVVNWVPF